jgi:hypothetical protein
LQAVLRPILDETAPTTSNFFAAKDEDIFLKLSGIVWSKASIHIAETHDDNPVALRPLAGWHATPSIPIGGKHRTIVVTPTPPEYCMANTNIAATLTIWEYQLIWLIMAYFPNDLENTKAMEKALGNIINKLKNKSCSDWRLQLQRNKIVLRYGRPLTPY